MNDAIGDRFKGYERCYDFALPRRLPLVIRVDGRAFHGLKLTKPFDWRFADCMALTAIALCEEVQGTVLAYVQSDEISIVARDDMQNTTEPWVGKRLSKMLSLSAAIATATFNHHFGERRQFDSRAFVLPDLTEVENYLIWRQQDATRNSVSMAAHAAFSHSSLQGVNTNAMLDRLREAGKPWEEVPIRFKRGVVVRKETVMKWTEYLGREIARSEWTLDAEPPIFTQERAYLSRLYRSVEPEVAGSEA